MDPPFGRFLVPGLSLTHATQVVINSCQRKGLTGAWGRLSCFGTYIALKFVGEYLGCVYFVPSGP